MKDERSTWVWRGYVALVASAWVLAYVGGEILLPMALTWRRLIVTLAGVATR